MDELIHIGKIVATFGVKGDLILKHVLGKKTVFKANDVLFVDMKRGEQLPYFIQSSSSKKKDETIVKLEGVETKEAAAAFIQKKIWLTKVEFDKLVSKNAPVNLIGFSVVDKAIILGEVEAVIEQPQQILLQITINKKEVLIPVHEATLKKIDRKKNQIFVQLPEGLLEIYMA